jgi:hypothetical protein
VVPPDELELPEVVSAAVSAAVVLVPADVSVESAWLVVPGGGSEPVVPVDELPSVWGGPSSEGHPSRAIGDATRSERRPSSRGGRPSSVESGGALREFME